MDDEAKITLLLEQAHEGDQAAWDAVAREVHGHLVAQARRLMARRAARGNRAVTLEPAELVNESFLRLLRQRTRYRNREHFFAIATTIMLRVLMDHHKARSRRKRSGDRIRVSLSAASPKHAAQPSAEVPDLIAAFEELDALDPRATQVAKLRALWGLTPDEVAEVIGVSRSTADRDWRFARTWLATRLQ